MNDSIVNPPELPTVKTQKSWWKLLHAFGVLMFHLASTFGAYFLILVFAIAWVIVAGGEPQSSEQLAKLATDGDLVFPSFLLTTVFSALGVGLVIVWVQREKLRDVLALRAVSGVQTGGVVLATLALMGFLCALDLYLQRPMNETMAEMLQIFSLGIMLSVIREKTGSLWPCILAHLLWNTISSIGMEYWLQEQAPHTL